MHNLTHINRFLQSAYSAAEYLPPNMYIFCISCWFRLKGWGVGLSLYTVTCPLITDYHRLFVLWPVAVYKISHRSWRMLGNSLSGIQHGTGIFGKSNFISTNMHKMKTNTTQTANYHPLGPLSPIFLRETQNGRLHRAHPAENLRELLFPPSRGQPGIIQVDTLRAPVIFQTYYFMCKVINYTTDTSLVSSGPCGLNQRQILCH